MGVSTTIGYALIVSICVVPLSIGKDTAVPLSISELKQRFGQENTTFNDGKSCYRICDGTIKTCYYEFHVDNYDTMNGLCGDCANGTLEDCFNAGCLPGNGVQRNIMPVNRRLPGPPINVCKDDRIIVDVTNHLAGSEMTIHWHGLYQKDSPWMDGVPMVTQCPIFSGNTFRYAFNAREPGTHYYHAHTGVHRSNGVVGKVNVREQNDPNAKFYDYDLREHSILLADWNNFLAEEKVPGIKSAPLQPDSILINGYGSYFDKDTGNYTYAPMEVFYVERNKRHRFRIDNAASHNCAFEFCIRGHNLTVIATDGYSVVPLTVDCVVTQAGERYDVVLHAKPDFNETLIIVRGLGNCIKLKLQEFARLIFVDDYSTHKPKIEDHKPLAIRPNYTSPQDLTKSTLNHPQTNCADRNSNSYCIAALESKGIKSPTGGNLRNEPVERVIPFEFRVFSVFNNRPDTYFTAGDLAIVTTINNISATHTPVSLLTQDDSHVSYCDAGNLPSNCDRNSVCYCNHMVELELCKNYEFFLIDNGKPGGAVSHPIHLHGYGFQVIDMGTLEQYKKGQTGFENSTKLPVVKDTVTLPSGGFVRLRFKTCNPGYWFFHCHFEYHMHVGMRAIIKVGNKTDMVPPPPNFPKCDNFYLPVYESCSS